MEIKVKLFAALSELVGERELIWELTNGATIEDLMQELANAYSEFAPRQANLHTALNRKYVPRSTKLADGDEVAIFPPVSGG